VSSEVISSTALPNKPAAILLRVFSIVHISGVVAFECRITMCKHQLQSIHNSQSFNYDYVQETNRIVSYRIGTVSEGSCLYAHIYIRNIINNIITLRITSTSDSKEWCFKIIHSILVKPKRM